MPLNASVLAKEVWCKPSSSSCLVLPVVSLMSEEKMVAKSNFKSSKLKTKEWNVAFGAVHFTGQLIKGAIVLNFKPSAFHLFYFVWLVKKNMLPSLLTKPCHSACRMMFAQYFSLSVTHVLWVLQVSCRPVPLLFGHTLLKCCLELPFDILP